MLPASWQEWHRARRDVSYYGGTQKDVVRTFAEILRDVESAGKDETGPRRARIYHAYEVSEPSSGKSSFSA